MAALYSPGQAKVKALTARIPSPRGHLHRADEVVHLLAKVGVVLDRIQVEIGQMDHLEGVADVDHEYLEAVTGDLFPHPVYGGVINVAHRRPI